MRRLEVFIDDLNISEITSFDILISITGIPTATITFDQEIKFTIFGNPKYQTFPRFEFNKEVLDFDFQSNCFVLE